LSAKVRKKKGDDALALALAAGQSFQDAATAAGVDERTARRRWDDHGFRQRVAALRTAMVDQAVGRLSEAMVAAALVLRSLLGSGTPPNVRLGAARSLLELGTKIRESVEIEARLTALEQRYKDPEK
jgi:HEAT repeat protein